VRNFDDNAKDTLDEWINFLKNETIPNNVTSKGLLKASQELDYMKMSKEEKIEIAKNLIIANVNLDIIKQTTGLTDRELANITDRL
jgi:hypothetical protein